MIIPLLALQIPLPPAPFSVRPPSPPPSRSFWVTLKFGLCVLWTCATAWRPPFGASSAFCVMVAGDSGPESADHLLIAFLLACTVDRVWGTKRMGGIAQHSRAPYFVYRYFIHSAVPSIRYRGQRYGTTPPSLLRVSTRSAFDPSNLPSLLSLGAFAPLCLERNAQASCENVSGPMNALFIVRFNIGSYMSITWRPPRRGF